MWKGETWSAFAMRSEVKYSFTEKCENCTICPRLSPLTIATKLEQAESTAVSAFGSRQLGSKLGIPDVSSSKLIAKTSASSSTRSGREDTVSHWRMQWASFHIFLRIPCNIRSYVSSRVSGNSSKVLRM